MKVLRHLLLSSIALLAFSKCAHRPDTQPTPQAGQPTVFAAPSATAPTGVTESAIQEMPGDSTAPAMETDPVAAPHIHLRPSPPAVGLDDLALVPEATSPGRKASLSLSQAGRLAWLNREPDSARQKLQTALQIWGSNPYALYYLGVLELDYGHYAQAGAFARKAASQFKENLFWTARAELLASEAFARSGDRERSFAARKRAFDLDPRAELR